MEREFLIIIIDEGVEEVESVVGKSVKDIEGRIKEIVKGRCYVVAEEVI